MEGVVVSAKKDGSTISVSVVTNAAGRFAFPVARLEPGHYALKARAAGYELDGARAADVASGQEAKAEIKLKKVKNLSAQLTNAEWLISMPGTDEQKRFLLNCTGCHTLERIMKSTHDADGFMEVFQRMSLYYPGSTPLKPQRLAGTANRDVERGGNGGKTAEWLASVNLSEQPAWAFPLKTQPRLTGKSTRVIITEYDLPNPLIQPHDVMLDRAGNVWYSDFGQMFLGKMDPQTGKVTQYSIPVVKPGWPEGTLDLEFDTDDNPWVGVMYQNAIAKFDKKTEKFQMWTTPKEWDTDGGPASASGPTASTRTRRTTPICSIFRPVISSRSMPRRRRRPSTRLRRRTPARGAVASIAKAGCGLPNIRATRSACSIPKPNA